MEKFKNLGEFFIAVRNASQKEFDPRLVTSKQLGQNEGTMADGGYAVPSSMLSEVLYPAMMKSPLYSNVTRFTVKTSNVKIPVVAEATRGAYGISGTAQAYFICESSEKHLSQIEFCQLDLTLKKLVTFVATTDELLEDAPLLTQVLNKVMPDAIVYAIDGYLVYIMINSPITIGIQNPSAIDDALLVSMFNSLLPDCIPNARWYMSKLAYNEVVVAGSPGFWPAPSLGAGPFGSIFGIPISVIPQMNGNDIILADPTQIVLIEKDAKLDSSIHVLFETDETKFRLVKRVEADVTWCNQIETNDDNGPYSCIIYAMGVGSSSSTDGAPPDSDDDARG